MAFTAHRASSAAVLAECAGRFPAARHADDRQDDQRRDHEQNDQIRNVHHDDLLSSPFLRGFVRKNPITIRRTTRKTASSTARTALSAGVSTNPSLTVITPFRHYACAGSAQAACLPGSASSNLTSLFLSGLNRRYRNSASTAIAATVAGPNDTIPIASPPNWYTINARQ